jgi:hypothetical protein
MHSLGVHQQINISTIPVQGLLLFPKKAIHHRVHRWLPVGIQLVIWREHDSSYINNAQGGELPCLLKEAIALLPKVGVQGVLVLYFYDLDFLATHASWSYHRRT